MATDEEMKAESDTLREVTETLKQYNASEAVGVALKQSMLLKRMPQLKSFQRQMYSKHLLTDLVDDCRCLLSSDIEHNAASIDTIYNFDNQFCQSTRIDLLSEQYSHISPIYCEPGRVVFELETNDHVFVLRTLSAYAMWEWIRALRSVFKYWMTHQEEDKPSWPSDQFRAYLEVENAADKIQYGFGSIFISKPFSLFVEVKESKDGLIIDGLKTLDPLQVFQSSENMSEMSLQGLCAIIVSRDFNVPKEFNLRVQVFNFNRRLCSSYVHTYTHT